MTKFDKIMEHIYSLDDRRWEFLKMLFVLFFISLTLFIYYSLQIPGKLAEREKIIDEYFRTHQSYIDAYGESVNGTSNDGVFEPAVIWYDSLGD